MIDRNESPEALAQVANVPIELSRLVFAAAGCSEGVALLRSPGRGEILVGQRHAVAWAARDYLGATYEQIGRAINRDHSVVVRGYNAARRMRRNDPEFRELSNALARTVAGRTVARTAHRRPRREAVA
ncbi:hypothetical protein DMC47_20515 [Nostoc sp. 3335mG]|jgi:hypothetical protein|nr:hypothetical protein DMC47_20515 [Nostoc sp. 3335mG]